MFNVPKILQKTNKKSWQVEEDTKLLALIAAHGTESWKVISSRMETERTSKQCRERYYNQLSPHLKKTGWTKDEDAVIVEMHAKVGNHWTKIAQHLPGRTDNAIKNRWHLINRCKPADAKANPAAAVETPIYNMNEFPTAPPKSAISFSGTAKYLGILEKKSKGYGQLDLLCLFHNHADHTHVDEIIDYDAVSRRLSADMQKIMLNDVSQGIKTAVTKSDDTDDKWIDVLMKSESEKSSGSEKSNSKSSRQQQSSDSLFRGLEDLDDINTTSLFDEQSTRSVGLQSLDSLNQQSIAPIVTTIQGQDKDVPVVVDRSSLALPSLPPGVHGLPLGHFTEAQVKLENRELPQPTGHSIWNATGKKERPTSINSTISASRERQQKKHRRFFSGRGFGDFIGGSRGMGSGGSIASRNSPSNAAIGNSRDKETGPLEREDSGDRRMSWGNISNRSSGNFSFSVMSWMKPGNSRPNSISSLRSKANSDISVPINALESDVNHFSRDQSMQSQNSVTSNLSNSDKNNEIYRQESLLSVDNDR